MANATTPAALISDGGASSGGGPSFRQAWKVFNSEPVANATAVVDSIVSTSVNGFDCAEFGYFGLWCKVDSTGTPTMSMSILQSFNDTAANYVKPNIGATIAASIVTTAAQVFVVTPTPLPKVRFEAAGGAGAPTDMKVTAVLYMVR